MSLEGEIDRPQEARDILRELLGFDKEAKPEPTPEVSANEQAIMEAASGVFNRARELETAPVEPKTVLTSTVTYTEHYSVDQVADAVKLVVSKHGVPRAAALLKEFGGARAGDVPAENRAAFIAKASEVAA